MNARPSADLEAAGSILPTALQSALVCPLVFGERVIGTLAVYHTRRASTATIIAGCSIASASRPRP